MSELEEFDAILDGDEVAEPVVEPEPEPEKEPEPEPTPEPEPEPEKEEPEGKTTVPKENEWTLTAVMDEREKRQKAVKEAEELKKKLAELEKPEKDVSVFEDEKAWNERQQAKLQEGLANTALNMSQAFAEETFGEDKVKAATEWMQSEGVKSPYVVEQFNKAKLPYHEAVKMFEAEQARLDPDAYKAKLKEELLAELKDELKPEETPTPDITPSLASSRAAAEKTVAASENYEDMLGD